MRVLAVLGVVVFPFLAACSGLVADEAAASDPDAAAEPTGPSAPSSPPADTNEAGSDAGAPDEPPPLPTAPPNAGIFADAGPYQAVLGPSTIDKSGKGNGHLSFDKKGNPAGRACLDCHDGTGKGGAPAFSFAGTVFADAAGTKPAPQIEVRVVGADGAALTAYTDANGNFFFRANEGTPQAPASAGARSASASRTMGNKISVGNCNQCHGTTMRIVL